jgi:hypothetical protein
LDNNEKLGPDEHDYQFVGKIGQFTPIKPGLGGGLLMRKSTDKDGNVTYGYASGAKGYRWVETSVLEPMSHNLTGENGVFDIIDMSYFDKQVNDAIESISEYVNMDILTE